MSHIAPAREVTSEKPTIAQAEPKVFYDGMLRSPRLRHPECVAVDFDGSVWCGTADGSIVKIDQDGQSAVTVLQTKGFVLGFCFACHLLVICDRSVNGIIVYKREMGHLSKIAAADCQLANYPAFDAERNCVFVSDSYGSVAGPGIWQFDLTTLAFELWWPDPLHFANGLALSPLGSELFVAESHAKRIVAIEILPDGRPGLKRVFAYDLPAIPDGLAFDSAGELFVGCYEPSAVLQVDEGVKLNGVLRDPSAAVLCHPTNLAFRGQSLFTTNLGRWHVSEIRLSRSTPILNVGEIEGRSL